MKVLVVGLNPSRKHGKSLTLKRLYEWMNYLDIETFSFTNLYEGYAIQKTASQLDAIKQYSRKYDRVVSLGQTTHRALSSVGIDHFPLPHPSGLNRSLNDKNFVHDRLELCKNYLRGN